MTGMRIGEAAALQWSDIDFEAQILSIDKNLYYESMEEYKFVEPKTQGGVRDIMIDADTIKELEEWKEVQQKVLTNCDFVLSYGRIPTSKHTLPRALEKLAELAGVHRIKIQTTLGTYGHLYPPSMGKGQPVLFGKPILVFDAVLLNLSCEMSS